MQNTSDVRCFGENAIEIVVRDMNGAPQLRLEIPIPNSLDLATIMGKIVEFSAQLKDPPPRNNYLRSSDDTSTSSPQNRATVDGCSVVLPQQSQGTANMSRDDNHASTSTVAASYASVAGGNQDRSRFPQIGRGDNSNPIQLDIRSQYPGIHGSQATTIDLTRGSEQYGGYSAMRPMPCGPVLEPFVVDARNQDRWRTNECWQGKMSGGSRVKRSWIESEARRFPECMFRDADYLWPSGKAQLFLWFAPEAQEAAIKGFMMLIARHVVPFDSILMRPGSYNLIPSKVNPGGKKAGKQREKPSSIFVTRPDPVQPRTLAQKWPNTEQGMIAKIVHCSGSRLPFPELKDGLRKAGLKADGVFMERVEGEPNSLLCTFHSTVEEDMCGQVIEHLTQLLGAKGFELLDPTESPGSTTQMTEEEDTSPQEEEVVGDASSTSPSKRKRQGSPDKVTVTSKETDRSHTANWVQGRIQFTALSQDSTRSVVAAANTNTAGPVQPPVIAPEKAHEESKADT